MAMSYRATKKHEATIGARLLEWRLKNDLTLQETGVLLRLHAASVARIESGQVKPQKRTAYRILKLVERTDGATAA